MTLILCADDRDGLLFHNRRLSRDSVLCNRILELCGNKTLWMNSYSASIFPRNTPNIRVSEKFLEEAGEGEFCFVENTEITEVLSRTKTLVIYRWNRSYPSDVKLPESLLEGKKPVSTLEFAGSSHPSITQEVYKL
ncbi:MAG: ribonuclease Z [Oscillospiraceae bacterium]|nr:ribonuclease Z [Oscillospiraceae bacterium]